MRTVPRHLSVHIEQEWLSFFKYDSFTYAYDLFTDAYDLFTDAYDSFTDADDPYTDASDLFTADADDSFTDSFSDIFLEMNAPQSCILPITHLAEVLTETY